MAFERTHLRLRKVDCPTCDFDPDPIRLLEMELQLHACEGDGCARLARRADNLRGSLCRRACTNRECRAKCSAAQTNDLCRTGCGELLKWDVKKCAC